MIGIRSGRLPRQYYLWIRFLLDIIQESKGAGLRKLQIFDQQFDGAHGSFLLLLSLQPGVVNYGEKRQPDRLRRRYAGGRDVYYYLGGWIGSDTKNTVLSGSSVIFN